MRPHNRGDTLLCFLFSLQGRFGRHGRNESVRLDNAPLPSEGAASSCNTTVGCTKRQRRLELRRDARTFGCLCGRYESKGTLHLERTLQHLRQGSDRSSCQAFRRAFRRFAFGILVEVPIVAHVEPSEEATIDAGEGMPLSMSMSLHYGRYGGDGYGGEVQIINRPFLCTPPRTIR